MSQAEFSIILKPGIPHQQIVKHPFIISQARVQSKYCGNVTFVYFETDDDEFLICRLCDQLTVENLQINLKPRNKIIFKTYGNEIVQLTCQYTEDGRKRKKSLGADSDFDVSPIPLIIFLYIFF